MSTNTDETAPESTSDVNGDSQLNTGDMVTVLNFLAGNPTTFAGCVTGNELR